MPYAPKELGSSQDFRNNSRKKNRHTIRPPSLFSPCWNIFWPFVICNEVNQCSQPLSNDVNCRKVAQRRDIILCSLWVLNGYNRFGRCLYVHSDNRGVQLWKIAWIYASFWFFCLSAHWISLQHPLSTISNLILEQLTAEIFLFLYHQIIPVNLRFSLRWLENQKVKIDPSWLFPITYTHWGSSWKSEVGEGTTFKLEP